ncbi:MAG: LysR family transcriptional regulator [Armatimonadetes bacterium]|nr:LysR family transcriptional regulator [Armatimonadota bacterium]
MELYQLKLFVDLAEKKNFTQVANENYVTQAAVTLQIRKLESELGVPLFHRTTRAVTLLEAGNRLLPYAQNMLKMAEEAREQVRETKTEVSGLVRVASVHSVGLYELPAYIKKFLQKFPHVNLRIAYRTSDDIYRELLAGDIDVGIVAYPSEMSRIECRPFSVDELALVCMKDHAFAHKKNVTLGELEGQNFVQFTEETPTRRATDAVLAEHGVTVNVRTECDNIEILKQMIEIGYGIALLPRNALTNDDKERGLRMIELKDVKIERPLGILLLKNAPRFKAMRAFVDTLVPRETETP